VSNNGSPASARTRSVALNAHSQRYPTLLADPPRDTGQVGGNRDASHHYPIMPAERICSLPVGRLAAADAHRWLWTTNASLFAAKQVMESWGFTYRSILTWIKPRFGMGQYLRTQTEHLLLGTRGKAPVLFQGQGSWFYAPVQEHSHKPEEQYAIVERCSPGPYVELFARWTRLGWHVWGNEVASDVTL
jgi:N6-adenosine-specific RNA methylase IME4